MDCLLCKELSRLVDRSSSEYRDSRSSSFYQVSTEIAAMRQVEMERAKTNLQEHQLICDSSPRIRTFSLVRFHGPALSVRQMVA